ncbi:MAG: protoheme IX farnesyltransferase [Verrucomicrobia bacterium]|nr:protoheme IX farnesyltransferase [Verrucomicrobiota bacterium]
MKASAPSIPTPQSADRAGVGVLLELAKARLTSLVLLTTLVGFYLGNRGALDYMLMFHALLATGLVASGAAALNQYLEREYDACMPRTSGRPLPSGRVQPETVLIIGAGASILGLIYLATAVNWLTSVLGAITLGTYLFVYTPLKRVTTLNTLIGAIPGALPPVMGWTASRGDEPWGAWTLFAILFLWQIPHFLAIAWIYKDDYGKAGYAMLPVFDETGNRTRRHVLVSSLGLLIASLGPFWLNVTGGLYLAGVIVLNLTFVALAIRFCKHLTTTRARQLFFASIIFLPGVLTLMVLDKVR